MTSKRREYTREFKLEAVSLVVDHERKVAEVAESLGVGVSLQGCVPVRLMGLSGIA